MSESGKRGVIGCGMARHLKYFMLFQLDSKPIVFHIVFHEIEVRAKMYGLGDEHDLRCMPLYTFTRGEIELAMAHVSLRDACRTLNTSSISLTHRW